MEYRPNKTFFHSEPPPNEEELAAWRLWMSEVFIPLNLQMERAIIENGDLIIGEGMPKCFVDLCAHVAAYKPVIKKWELGDYSTNKSEIAFPEELRPYVTEMYLKLKTEQAKLVRSLNI